MSERSELTVSTASCSPRSGEGLIGAEVVAPDVSLGIKWGEHQ